MARKWMVLALAAVVLVTSSALLSAYPLQTNGLPDTVPEGEEAVGVFAPSFDGNGKLQLAFSETGHFYTKPPEIVITASNPDADIYYTTDGSEPTSACRKYSEPLEFLAPAREGLNVVTLKAVAVFEDEITRPLVHTFFIGKNAETRFDTLIFSISTDSEHLYDYDTGIFVPGRLRDEYLATKPGKVEPPDPANYNWRGREGERPAYVEVFTGNGERVIAQAAGIRAHGGWSRDVSQKSIRLIARNEYEEGRGKFHYNFFPGDTLEDGYGTPLNKYDQLVLRNGANDRDFGMLRHEAGADLIRQAGLRAATPARAAAVFLNGEYYGFAWLDVIINNKYLQDVYGAPTDDFQIVGNGELWIESGASISEKEDVEYLNSFCWKDLTDDRVYAEFEALVDVDNLLLYYAFETYMGNNDWPQNNLKRWRYTGPQEEGLAPELDGRWRFIAFDLDWTLGLYDNPVNPKKATWREMVTKNNSRYSYYLAVLLQRPELADKFSMIICDLAASTLSEENVRATVSRLYAGAKNEIGAALAARKYSSWVSEHSIAENHTNMALFARGRGEFMIGAMRDHFGFEEYMFGVEVTGGEAVIGTQKGTSALYFGHLTVPLSPVLPKYTVFDHWVVNGRRIYEPEITVSAADTRGGTVPVELVTREELPPLLFGTAYASSARNGCTLVNPNGEGVHTDGLYLTNDLDNPFLWAIPAASVAPGGELGLAGKGGAGPDDLLLIQMGFNLRQGRMIYLCDDSGRVLDAITAT